jgi:hypothetical protein
MVALLIAAGGCQTQQTTMVATLPPPNFNGPNVAPPRPAPVVTTYRPSASPKAPLASGPREWTPSAPARPWKWIVIHHSATPGGSAALFDKMHREKGWDELGYHFVIGNGTDSGDGQVEVGGRWPKQKWGAHAKTPDNRYNDYGIGICLVGDFQSDRPTAQQMQSLTKLVGHLMRTYRISQGNVIGHGDTKATDCPGRFISIAQIRHAAQAVADARGGAIPAAEAPEVQTAAAELLTPASQ